jgi:hypothetical protein
MSPLFLLLRNLTLFRHLTLIFFRSLMSCRSPLDLVFVLVFVQEQAPLMSVLHLQLPSPLALLHAHVLSPHLSHRRLWSAMPLTPSRPVGARRPLLPQATTPVRTCPNWSGRWPLGPACLQPLRQLRPGLTLRWLFLARCASLPCRMIIAWLRGANTVFASQGASQPSCSHLVSSVEDISWRPC